MNRTPLSFALAVFCFAFAGFISADDFKSKVIPGDTTLQQLAHVSGDQFMFIRNFTQEGQGSSRGTVSVTTPDTSSPVAVLSAATNTTPGTEDVINSVVIAGPATVFVNCGADSTSNQNCFISYKKEGGN